MIPNYDNMITVGYKSCVSLRIASAQLTLKSIFAASATDSEKQDLYQELEIMRKIPKHANIVTLLGCCSRKGNDCIYILECCLFHFLYTEHMTFGNITQTCPSNILRFFTDVKMEIFR